MYAVMPQTPPSFSFGRPGGSQVQPHRPTFSSPLSSPPMRTTSPPLYQQSVSQPLSPCNVNHLNSSPWQQQHQHQQRSTQSSPILAPPAFGIENVTTNSGSNNTKFRFASRNPRPNPLLKRREDAQEGRRRLFFQNVRQRQEDRRWEMRGGEDELLKLEHYRLTGEAALARAAETAILCLDAQQHADLVAREEEEVLRLQAQAQAQGQNHQDLDALMADAIAQQEAAELEALLELERGSDIEGMEFEGDEEEDYDGLFREMIRREEGGDVEMS
ncbi:hypothetical protein C8A05DRAFT_32414 [Staphylotrichum tortipilum]|uniref:Uncharacterized protein n=1 Tax=Staphylotrichum tortipilum TaxID=2831512 RepID=A0AAN6MNZ3_9PEZI|nr:hypothetical protein C8A05DRAFT_32414 [Staphylotrichum longicolle]